MARIDSIIPVSYFEQIRDRIGAILALEIENQLLLSGNYEIDSDIFVERSIPFDKVEIPTLNISLATGSYDNKSQGYVRGTYDFFIDVYTSSKAGNGIDADARATFKLNRLLGIVRSILENPVYKTLDFTPPGIRHTECSSINIRSNQSRDALHTAMGRIIFKVVADETTTLLTPLNIAEHYTQVKLDLTDKGYQYKLVL